MSLKILTLNLWHDAGPYEQRAKQIRSWIDRLDPDLIGFQEALRGEAWDQAAELLAGRSFHLDYAAASHWAHRKLDFGNAIASRWPLHNRDVLALPESGDGETRTALSVDVDSPFGTLSFSCTHLNWKLHHGWIREQQVVALADWVLARRPRDGFPPILVGDFNAEPDSAEIRYLTGLESRDGRSVNFYDAWRVAGGDGPGFSWSNDNRYAFSNHEPNRRIDYVFAGYPRRKGIGRIESCQVVCNEASEDIWPSDHFGVFAELRTEPVPKRKGTQT